MAKKKTNSRLEIPITGKLRTLQQTNYLEFIKVYANLTAELRSGKQVN